MSHKTISDSSYVHVDVLVDTEWLEDHLQDQKLRVAEVDCDTSANYELGHMPVSVLIDWKNGINDNMKRNIISRALYENPI
jgi:thiosulfate/3-mercaptopyruvate sulfurtransferase